MASRKEILKRIRILITQEFDNPQDAFNFFDKNGDGYLTTAELTKLVKSAKVNGFLSKVVAKTILNGLDKDTNRKLNWKEFSKAVKKLMEE